MFKSIVTSIATIQFFAISADSIDGSDGLFDWVSTLSAPTYCETWQWGSVSESDTLAAQWQSGSIQNLFDSIAQLQQPTDFGEVHLWIWLFRKSEPIEISKRHQFRALACGAGGRMLYNRPCCKLLGYITASPARLPSFKPYGPYQCREADDSTRENRRHKRSRRRGPTDRRIRCHCWPRNILASAVSLLTRYLFTT